MCTASGFRLDFTGLLSLTGPVGTKRLTSLVRFLLSQMRLLGQMRLLDLMRLFGLKRPCGQMRLLGLK